MRLKVLSVCDTISYIPHLAVKGMGLLAYPLYRGCKLSDGIGSLNYHQSETNLHTDRPLNTDYHLEVLIICPTCND